MQGSGPKEKPSGVVFSLTKLLEFVAINLAK